MKADFVIRHKKNIDLRPWAGGATRMAKGGIRLVHGHTKSTLITYFSGMKIKIDPKLNTHFCMHFPSFVSHVLSKICLYDQKHTLFSNFAPLNDVRTYSAWSWKTTLITWVFGRAWYPLWYDCPPGLRPLVMLVHHGHDGTRFMPGIYAMSNAGSRLRFQLWLHRPRP